MESCIHSDQLTPAIPFESEEEISGSVVFTVNGLKPFDHKGIHVELVERAIWANGKYNDNQLSSVDICRDGLLFDERTFKFKINVPVDCKPTYLGQTVKHR